MNAFYYVYILNQSKCKCNYISLDIHYSGIICTPTCTVLHMQHHYYMYIDIHKAIPGAMAEWLDVGLQVYRSGVRFQSETFSSDTPLLGLVQTAIIGEKRGLNRHFPPYNALATLISSVLVSLILTRVYHYQSISLRYTVLMSATSITTIITPLTEGQPMCYTQLQFTVFLQMVIRTLACSIV